MLQDLMKPIQFSLSGGGVLLPPFLQMLLGAQEVHERAQGLCGTCQNVKTQDSIQKILVQGNPSQTPQRYLAYQCLYGFLVFHGNLMPALFTPYIMTHNPLASEQQEPIRKKPICKKKLNNPLVVLYWVVRLSTQIELIYPLRQGPMRPRSQVARLQSLSPAL